MSGLYNMLFGKNGHSTVILAALGLTEGDFERFRDCWVSDGEIHVYTRLGGGNREDYEPVYAKMKAHPQYLSDQDDDYDCTYATFRFSFPPEYAEQLAALGSDSAPSGAERWAALFAALGAEHDEV